MIGMSYSEIQSEEFFYFSDKEKDLVEGFLERFGYKIDRNTVCGGCCGMYADEYWLDGIGGGWKKKEDVKEFKKFVKDNEISCSFSDFNPDGYNYTISADPNAREIRILN